MLAIVFVALAALLLAPAATPRARYAPLGQVTLKLPPKGHGLFYELTITGTLTGNFTYSTWSPQLAGSVPDTVRAAAVGDKVAVRGKSESQTIIVAVNNLTAPKSMADAGPDAISMIFVGGAGVAHFHIDPSQQKCMGAYTAFLALEKARTRIEYRLEPQYLSTVREIFTHTYGDCQ